MTRAGRQRLTLAALALLALGGAAALALVGLEERITFYRTPAEITAAPPPVGEALRLGGLVAADSVRPATGGAVHFAVTDGQARVKVRYDGLLPDLFAEGQGVVVLGRRAAAGHFEADKVLARHDETYRPPGVAAAGPAMPGGPDAPAPYGEGPSP